jgi:hypothetical protein
MSVSGRSLANQLRDLEHQFFFAPRAGEATPEGFIAGNTWRGWRSTPKEDGVIKEALQHSFDHLTPRFQGFLHDTRPLTCESFDRFHESQVESLREFLESFRQGISIHPAAAGEFYRHSYGAYAKIVNLAYTHWCFLPRRNKAPRRFDPESQPDLRKCLHVPLDEKVLEGIQGLIDRGDFSAQRIPLPKGKAGMGLVTSRQQYMDIQLGMRAVVSDISSKSFKGHSVSPLAFEGFWQST